jgi:hypothetical protein
MVLETDEHIFTSCPQAVAVWNQLSITIRPGQHKYLWAMGATHPLPDQVRDDVMLTVLWHIWKAQNDQIFERQDPPSQSPSKKLFETFSFGPVGTKKLVCY